MPDLQDHRSQSPTKLAQQPHGGQFVHLKWALGIDNCSPTATPVDFK